MIDRKWLFLVIFSILTWFSLASHQGLSAFIVADFNGTYIQMTIPKEAVFSQNFITECSLPIYAILPSKTLQCFRFNSKLLRHYKQTTDIDAASKCHLLPFGLSESFFLVTVLDANRTSVSIHLNSSFSKSEANPEQFALAFNEKIKTPIIPAYFFSRFRASSVEEGKNYFDYFAEAHFNKNLSIYPDLDPEGSTVILTLPRSGTHVYLGTLELIYEEFIGLFRKGYLDEKGFDVSSGVFRPSKGFTRIEIQHHPPPKHINRIVYGYRDIVEAIDSRFRLFDSSSSGRKLKKGYPKEPQFKQFLQAFFIYSLPKIERFFEPRLHKYFVDFTDLKSSPEDTFCQIISYIDRFPCEYSWKPKIIEVLQEKGLVSSYETSPKESFREMRQKTKELYEDYGQELVFMIMRSSFMFMASFFGNDIFAKEVFTPGFKRPEDYEPLYKKINRKEMERTLHYRDDFKPPNFQNEMIFGLKNIRKNFGGLDRPTFEEMNNMAVHPVFEKYLIE